MALKHSVYDTDTHFTINPNTRVLKNESMGKTSLIQYDHNSERFTFEIPRMIEGHDMSLCDVVQIHYNNIDSQTKEQSKGVYDVDDMQISPEDDNVVILSWLISGNATKYVGSLNFLVRFACTDEDGTVIYAWNTAIYTGISISSGINNSEDVAYEYADILEQWRAELDAQSKLLENVRKKVVTHGSNIAELRIAVGDLESKVEALEETGGATGADGKSAYEIWLEQGNTGSEADFLASLKGENGADGKDGANGSDGEDGRDGEDGTSVTVTSITESTEDGGNNVVTFSDGNTLTVKNGSTGSAGLDGADGESITITDTELTTTAGGANQTKLTFSDGTEITISDGERGARGADGADGKSTEITNIELSEEDGGENTVTFSDGELDSVIVIRNGNKGADGYTPVKGTDYFTNADKTEMVNNVINNSALKDLINSLILERSKKDHPVNSVYITATNTNPNSILGFGTWSLIAKDRMLIGAGNKYSAGATGGAETVTLTAQQLPSVTGQIGIHGGTTATNIHTVQGCFSAGITNTNKYVNTGTGTTGADSIGQIRFSNGGSGQAHNNMPPYLAVYVWKRTA